MIVLLFISNTIEISIFQFVNLQQKFVFATPESYRNQGSLQQNPGLACLHFVVLFEGHFLNEFNLFTLLPKTSTNNQTWLFWFNC